MSDEPEEQVDDGTETIGEIYIRTLIDHDGKMAHAHRINGMTDMEALGLLFTVAVVRLAAHLGQDGGDS